MKTQKQSIRWGYLLSETAMILFGSYLLLVASTKTNQLNPVILLINAVLLTGAAAFLLFRSRGQSGLEIPIAVMMGVMLIASFTSIDPRRSLGEFGLVAIPVTLFFIIQEAVKRNLPKELIVKSLLAVGAIFMIFSWQKTIGWYAAWLNANPGEWMPSSNYRLDNPNLMAMLFNVWLMMAAGRFIASRSRSEKVILGIFSFSCLGIIFFSSSRGGWMATVAGFACLGWVYFRTRRESWAPVWERFRKSRLRMAGAVIVLMAVLAPVGLLLVRQMTHPSHGGRNAIWTPAVHAFLQSPLIGKGPFTFISDYLQVNSVPPIIPYDYAHNIYLDLLSGTGILGLAAFFWIMAAVVRLFLIRIRETSGPDWAVSIGGLAALVTFLVHGLVDSTHHSEPISLWNMCIVAGTALTLPGGEVKARNWRSFAPAVLALAAAGMTWFSWWTLLPMQEGVQRAAEGDWPGAAALFEEAARRDAGMAAAHQQAGLALSMQVDVGDDDNLEEAIIYYERAAAIDPYWGLNHANLAALYQSAGRVEEARAAFARAVRLSPECEIYHLNLGVVREEMGDLADAEDSYIQVLSLKPEWAGSGFWRTGEFRRASLEKWQAANPAEPEKDLTAMKAVIKSRPDAIAAYLPLIETFLEQENYIEAQKLLSRAQFAAGSNSLHLELGWQTAELKAARGEVDQAVAAGREVILSATRYGIFGPATSGNKIYNLFMFRRPAVDVDFVPQLLVIAWPDKWGRRALTLADWMEANGDLQEADRWRHMVKDQIPDLAQP